MNNSLAIASQPLSIDYNKSNIKGFFSWQGNPGVTFQESHFLVYIIYAFIIIVAILLFIFKNSLHVAYNNKDKRFLGFRSRKTLNITVGIIGLFFYFLRIIILGIGGYPNTWELIPLQFCRLFILLLLLLFVFNKIHLIKYIGFFSIAGAVIGLSIPDLSNSPYWSVRGGMDVGYNSYVFWDFFFAHSFAFLCPMFLFTFTGSKITKKEMLYSTNALMIFVVVIFFIDLLSAQYGTLDWHANYFYMGMSSQITVFGPGSAWPASFFVYSILGYVLYTLFLLIWIFLSKNQIHWVKKNKLYRPVYTWIKSEKIVNFKEQKFFHADNRLINYIFRKNKK